MSKRDELAEKFVELTLKEVEPRIPTNADRFDEDFRRVGTYLYKSGFDAAIEEVLVWFDNNFNENQLEPFLAKETCIGLREEIKSLREG